MTERPTLRVVSGDATAEEIAAVVAAVAATAPGDADGDAGAATTSIWAARGSVHRHIRAMFTPSPDAWRTSFWPR